MAKLQSPNPFVPFFPGDRATAPMALEESSDSAFQRFQQIHEAHEQGFALTEPGAPAGTPNAFMNTQAMERSPKAAAPAEPRRKELTLDQVMLIARRNNRACPQPAQWAQLHAMLPARESRGDAIEPPPPIDGAAWGAVSPMQKRLRLRDQLEWAEEGGALAAVHDFLSALTEEQWLHMDQ